MSFNRPVEAKETHVTLIGNSPEDNRAWAESLKKPGMLPANYVVHDHSSDNSYSALLDNSQAVDEVTAISSIKVSKYIILNNIDWIRDILRAFSQPVAGKRLVERTHYMKTNFTNWNKEIVAKFFTLLEEIHKYNPTAQIIFMTPYYLATEKDKETYSLVLEILSATKQNEEETDDEEQIEDEEQILTNPRVAMRTMLTKIYISLFDERRGFNDLIAGC